MALRIAHIAACTGAAKGTLYLYFPSKDAIFKALARKQYRQLATGDPYQRVDETVL